MSYLKDFVSMEAIDFQGESLLFKELKLKFQSLIDGEVYTQKAIDQLNLEKIIKKHTGLNTVVKLEMGYGIPDAALIAPFVDKNHPMITEGQRALLKSKNDYDELKKFTRKMEGQINLKKGIVSGFFSDIEYTLYLSDGLFTAPEAIRFTAGEAAAGAMHELGHAFALCEYIGNSYTTNLALQSMVDRFNVESEKNVRVRIVEETAELIGHELDNSESLAKMDGDIARIVILGGMSANKKKRRSLSHLYDNVSFEFISDQFAVKHNAGKDLVTSLNKMHSSAGSRELMSPYVYYPLQAMKIAALITPAVVAPGLTGFPIVGAILGLSLGLNDPALRVYDDPLDRLQRISEQTTANLKNATLPKALKTSILKDLEEIDKVISKYVKRDGLSRRLLNIFSASYRLDGRQKELQRELEKLGSNELFKHAAILDTIKS